MRNIRDAVVRIRALFFYTFLRLTFSIIVEFGPIWAGLRFCRYFSKYLSVWCAEKLVELGLEFSLIVRGGSRLLFFISAPLQILGLQFTIGDTTSRLRGHRTFIVGGSRPWKGWDHDGSW